MECKKCNAKVNETDSFCWKCGNPLNRIEILSETISLDIAKILAHKLNNALSIILANSQLASYQIQNLPENAKLKKILNDIELSADNSGILIHQFQDYINAIEQKLPQSEIEIYASKIMGDQQSENIIKLFTANNEKIKSTRNIPPSIRQASILIVDDEDKIRYAMSYALTLGGHSITTASNGQEALKLIRNKDYNIAFIDLILPDIDGWEIVNIIRQISPKTMIVLMTGWNIRLDDKRLKEANLDTVLTKPFQLSDVTDLVESVLEK